MASKKRKSTTRETGSEDGESTGRKRALWRGAISFGLVSIPIEIYSAARDNDLSFDMLDKRDFAPIGYHRYNKKTGKEVVWGDIVKGYEYEKGKYVVLTDEDFRRANVEATQTVDIQAFVPEGSIPFEYFDHPYYLQPAKQGQRAYALLLEAMKKAGRVAVASFVLRTRQRICALIPNQGVMLLNTLRFAEEVVPASKVASAGKAASVSPKELAMAQQLIGGLADDWKPGSYRDTYRDDLMKRVKEKIRSRKTHELTERDESAPEAEPKSNVVDLVALLQQSLKGGKAKRPHKRGSSKSSTARAKRA